MGPRLLNVRCRVDAEQERCWKTVELIVDERAWSPKERAGAERAPVHGRLSVAEVLLRRAVKAAGGQWEPETQMWLLAHEAARQLGLEARMVRPRRSPPARMRRLAI